MMKFFGGTIAALILCSCGSSLVITDKGKTNYSIVVAANADSLTMVAAKSLQRYVNRISNVELPIVAPSQVVDKEKVITIGVNELVDTAGLAIDGLGHDGFTIRTQKSGQIAIVAATPRGAVNGVYTLLDNYFGCRKYSSTVEVVPTNETLKIEAGINDRQVPVITFRDAHYRGTNDQAYIDWHKLSHDSTGNKPDWGLWCHSFERLVPPAEYLASHPEYYSLVNGKRIPAQLCLSNPEVLEIACRNLAVMMAANPQATCWSVSSNDNFDYCQCDACAAIDSIEGSATGSVIRFVNAVADRFPNKTISTLAYQYSRAAPKVTKPRSNVNIMFCSIECNRNEPIATDSTSASFRFDMENWAKLTDNILVWDYVIQFKNLVSPFPNLHVIQPNIEYFVDNSVVALFEQGNREVGGEFADLRAYMISKLLWNPNLNIDSLVTDFTDGFYGPAGVFVRQYIDAVTANLTKSGDKLRIFGSPCEAVDSYLSPANMATYQALFDKAEAAVSTNEDYLYRVKVARQPLYFAELEQTATNPAAENGIYVKDENGKLKANPEYLKKVEQFVALCKKEGVTRLCEWHTTPDEFLAMIKNMVQLNIDGNLAYGKQYTLSPEPGKQYNRDANTLLTNGLHGSNYYKMNWVGFDVPSFEVVVDLGSIQQFGNVNSTYCQALPDWISFPAGVQFSVSDDNKTYRSIGAGAIQGEVTNPSVGSRSYAVSGNFSGRYVKVVTTGAIFPLGHPGAGSLAWSFVDEIVVEK